MTRNRNVKLPPDLANHSPGVQDAVRAFAAECYDEDFPPWYRRRWPRLFALIGLALLLGLSGVVFAAESVPADLAGLRPFIVAAIAGAVVVGALWAIVYGVAWLLVRRL